MDRTHAHQEAAQPASIRPLQDISAEDIQRIMPGYTSTEKYLVSKVETPEVTTITLGLVTLRQPYVRQWTWEDFREIEEYRAMLSEGWSVGAYRGDRLVGFAISTLEQWNNTLWVWEFGVEEGCRRQGLGRAMLDELARLGRAASVRTLLVETQNTNVPAIRFYRAAGFTIEAVDLSYYTNTDAQDGEIAIFMKRALTSQGTHGT
jgi:ribosomal protein S18 acetylase RimI-like enzyme